MHVGAIASWCMVGLFIGAVVVVVALTAVSTKQVVRKHKQVQTVAAATAATTAAAAAAAAAVSVSAADAAKTASALPGLTMTLPEFIQQKTPAAATKSIPHIMWRTGPHPDATSMPPEVKQALVNTNKHMPPGMQQVYANDAHCRAYVQKFWPHVLEAYDSLVPGAFKADLWRLLALYDWGGVYADIGFLFMQDVHTALVDFAWDELVAVIDIPHAHREALYQAFLAAYPRHPIILAMIEALLDNVTAQEYGSDILDITGPTAVARAFRQFFGSSIGALVPGRHEWPDRQGRVLHRVALGQLLVDQPGPCPNVVRGPTGQVALCTKFPKYEDVMYKARGVAKYSDLYMQRAVFKPTVPFLTYPEFMASWTKPEPGSTKVPPVLWRTGWFQADALPPQVQEVMGSFTQLAPEWVQVYVTDADQVAFMQEFYPSALEAWRSLVPGAFRADLWRLLVLEVFGGLYVDLPQRLLRPLSSFFNGATDQFLGVLDRPGGTPKKPLYRLYQAILGAYPAHPIITAMTNRVLANVRAKVYGEDVLDITGPTAVGRAMMEVLGSRRLPFVGRHQVSVGKKPLRLTILEHEGNFRVVGPDNITQVFVTKFPDAHKVMYPPTALPKYNTFWWSRTVYGETPPP